MEGTVTGRQLPHTISAATANPYTGERVWTGSGHGYVHTLSSSRSLRVAQTGKGPAGRMGSKVPTPGSLSVKSTQKWKSPRSGAGATAGPWREAGSRGWVWVMTLFLKHIITFSNEFRTNFKCILNRLNRVFTVFLIINTVISNEFQTKIIGKICSNMSF